MALVPGLGWADGKPVTAMPAEVALASLAPAADGAESRSNDSLRNSLRQQHEEADSKPYRLSQQERQLLREQLRSQLYDTPKK